MHTDSHVKRVLHDGHYIVEKSPGKLQLVDRRQLSSSNTLTQMEYIHKIGQSVGIYNGSMPVSRTFNLTKLKNGKNMSEETKFAELTIDLPAGSELLTDVCNRGMISQPDIESILSDVSATIEALHSRNVAHLQPELKNIFVYSVGGRLQGKLFNLRHACFIDQCQPYVSLFPQALLAKYTSDLRAKFNNQQERVSRQLHITFRAIDDYVLSHKTAFEIQSCGLSKELSILRSTIEVRLPGEPPVTDIVRGLYEQQSSGELVVSAEVPVEVAALMHIRDLAEFSAIDASPPQGLLEYREEWGSGELLSATLPPGDNLVVANVYQKPHTPVELSLIVQQILHSIPCEAMNGAKELAETSEITAKTISGKSVPIQPMRLIEAPEFLKEKLAKHGHNVDNNSSSCPPYRKGASAVLGRRIYTFSILLLMVAAMVLGFVLRDDTDLKTRKPTSFDVSTYYATTTDLGLFGGESSLFSDMQAAGYFKDSDQLAAISWKLTPDEHQQPTLDSSEIKPGETGLIVRGVTDLQPYKKMSLGDLYKGTRNITTGCAEQVVVRERPKAVISMEEDADMARLSHPNINPLESFYVDEPRGTVIEIFKFGFISNDPGSSNSCSRSLKYMQPIVDATRSLHEYVPVPGVYTLVMGLADAFEYLASFVGHVPVYDIDSVYMAGTDDPYAPLLILNSYEAKAFVKQTGAPETSRYTKTEFGVTLERIVHSDNLPKEWDKLKMLITDAKGGTLTISQFKAIAAQQRAEYMSATV